MKLNTHRNAEQSFQLAFMATLITIIFEIIVSFTLALLTPTAFSVGGINVLPQNGENGTLNTPLLTGLAIIAIFFLTTAAAPFLKPSSNTLTPARTAIYILVAADLTYLTLTYIIIPLATGNIPALILNYWPITLGLSAAAAFTITSQPIISEREPKQKKPTPEVATADN